MATGKQAEVSRRYYQRRIKGDPQRYARLLEMGRESYRRHPEVAALYARQWRGENREQVRERALSDQKRRQPQMRGAPRRDIREYAAILLADPCVYCGKAATCIDHILALVNGGRHHPDNLAPTCRSCNARKRSRDVLHFLLAR